MPRNKIVNLTLNINVQLPLFIAEEVKTRLEDKRVIGLKEIDLEVGK